MLLQKWYLSIMWSRTDLDIGNKKVEDFWWSQTGNMQWQVVYKRKWYENTVTTFDKKYSTSKLKKIRINKDLNRWIIMVWKTNHIPVNECSPFNLTLFYLTKMPSNICHSALNHQFTNYVDRFLAFSDCFYLIKVDILDYLPTSSCKVKKKIRR